MNARLKILLFGYRPPPYFGPATAYHMLLESAFARDHDLTFINLSVVRDVSELEKFSLGKLVKLAGFLARELGYLVTRRYDFVCYPVSFNRMAFLKDALLLAVVRLFRVPTVLWAHGNGLPEFYAQSGSGMQRVIRWTIGRARAAIVLGENLRFNFDGLLPQSQVFVVPYGILPPPPVPHAATVPRPFTVLYLGNLIREKGVFAVLEAAPLVLAKHPRAQFVLAGAWWKEDDRRAAEKFIVDHQLADHVRFAGVVSGAAKQRVLAEADVLAFPTYYKYETFGLVVLEALAAGLPVVATRRVALPETIREGVEGLFVNEQDPADLAAKLLELADDPATRDRMSAAARQRFAEHYTHEHFGQRMTDVFHRLR